MVPNSPTDALGPHAQTVRDVLLGVIRSRHNRFADAHQVAGTRYSMAFGSQWRDLLDDTNDALTGRGFQSQKLTPAGYKIPVVHDCLVYVWRVPGSADAVSFFASSPTRKNGFAASPPPPMLFDPVLVDEGRADDDVPPGGELGQTLRAAGDKMPVVLVMVESSPWQLQSISWGVAVLDETTGKVEVRGLESIWEPTSDTDRDTSSGDSFDSGTPVGPSVEPRPQERPSTDD
ncbi:hypothetical protein Mycch_2657 [Mycolicibacterium chubuense NBB4]|uniref:Uncharacterized protein n=1 Tax=Mycolicibacterium chubuense (strain NBB4) TaxID=710421 RepID=I4BJG7_MYCCN|nr:hypothetical protein Mycch_2657 [Mycolicibacterium chubuense NBB4]